MCLRSAVSLENVLLDVKELNRGMELTKREYSMHGHNTMLKEFIAHNESKLKKLQDDAKIAQVKKKTPLLVLIALQFPVKAREAVKSHSERLPCLCLTGCIRGGCEVLRGELQNDATVRLLSCVCAIRESLQGEFDCRSISRTRRKNVLSYSFLAFSLLSSSLLLF